MRQAARQSKTVRFTALLHHITTDLLKRSYLALARDAASGIDGVTWQGYGESLEEKLKDLHDRVHRGSYRARPARRTYIPKADGSQRPLSILCLEDKIVQQAVVSLPRRGRSLMMTKHLARHRYERLTGPSSFQGSGSGWRARAGQSPKFPLPRHHAIWRAGQFQRHEIARRQCSTQDRPADYPANGLDRTRDRRILVQG